MGSGGPLSTFYQIRDDRDLVSDPAGLAVGHRRSSAANRKLLRSSRVAGMLQLRQCSVLIRDNVVVVGTVEADNGAVTVDCHAARCTPIEDVQVAVGKQ